MTHCSIGENSTDQMPLLCPLRTTEDTRLGSLHMQAVRSSEPLQTRPSLGETARELISLSCAATTAFALRETS
uniref:Uncharacterized protein n=1 Tax=Arundo donax TaxID=35708 RepID=A0A0A9D398_ARUDO